MDSSFGNDIFMGGAECSSADGLAAVIATYQQGLEEAINAAGSSRKRGGVYSSTVFDEDFGGEEDSLSDEKQVEKKRRLSVDQVKALEKNFEMENKLEPERKVQLARELGLQPRQVAVWFQNRRARWKTKQLEKDFDLLRSEYDDLKSSYMSLVKDKDMLQSEVARLQERLAEFRPPSSVKTCSAQVHQASGRVKVKEEDSEMLLQLNTCGDHVICKKEGSLSCESDGSEILEVDSARPAAADFVYENCYHQCHHHQNNICNNSMKHRLNSKEPEQDQGGAFTWPWDWA